MSTKEEFIKEKVDGMSLDQKIGALLTLGFNGTVLTSNIYDYVSKYHCGGLRLTPADRTFQSYIDPALKALEVEVAEKSCLILRSEPGALPLGREKKFLLVEQISTERNNRFQHPALMFKHALCFNPHPAFCEIAFSADAEDLARMNALIPDHDTVVITNFQDRASAAHTSFLEEQIAKHPDKTFVIVVNKPFAFTVPKNAENVICTFSKAPKSLEAAVRVLFGDLEPGGVLPLQADPTQSTLKPFQ